MKPRALALDVGTVRIGVALMDPEGKYALADVVLPAEPRADALRDIGRRVHEHHVSLVLIGLPLLLNGTEGEQAMFVRAFAEELAREVPCAIEFLDERFTTKAAQESARAKGMDTPDAEAARLILQTWLDRHQKA